MWGAVGLLWVALFVGARANLIQDTDCPVISHADEFYYLVNDLPYVRVTLSAWQGLDDDPSQPVVLDDCKGYPVGRNIKVTPGECDIECEACDAFDNCCSYKYTLTVIDKKCRDETIENGQLTVDSYLIGGSATVTCIGADYTLDGSPSVTCESNVDYAAANGGAKEVGKNDPSWANLPSCILKSCGNPSGIRNGNVNLDQRGNTQIGASATYECGSGYIIEGDASVQCISGQGQGDPRWEQAPTCREIQCSDDPEEAGPNGALKHNGRRNIGAKAWYTCDDGFLPRRRDIVCELNGDSARWSSGPPNCRRITCGKPGEGTKTLPVEIDGGNPGETYAYSCEPGFTAEPDTLQVECRLNNRKNAASWSADPPTCNEIQCSDDPEEAGPNGALKHNGERNIGAKAWYTCDDGFLPRRRDIVCELNGDSARWSSGPPNCRRITCGKPGEGSNTLPVEIDGGNPGETYAYRCKTGFTAEPDTLQVECRLNNRKNAASWSADPPTCNEAGATDIPTRCPRGFEAIGDRCYRIITNENTWEAQCRECKKRGGELALPTNARVNELLKTYISNNAHAGRVWIGIHALVEDNVWMSTDLRSLNFLNWATRPSEKKKNALVGPDCVSAAVDDGQWDNECCHSRYAAICEADPLGQEECNNEPRYINTGDRCLRFLEDPGSFEQQCENCFRSKGQLATALSESESVTLNKFYSAFRDGDQPAWFNLHDLCTDNTYQTTDLREIFFFDWAGGNPSGRGDCGSLTPGGWKKQCCHNEFPAVCELNACPRHYAQIGNTCYRILVTPDTWEANEKKCRKDGAHLAVIKNKGDLNNFQNFLNAKSNYLKTGLWFGCHDQIVEGVYQSPTLQSLSLFPQNSASGDCCALGRKFGMSAKCCYERLPAVCSLKANK